MLCALRLLQQLPPGAKPALQVHVFACPAIGNAALALYVKERGWEHHFSNMLIPGGPLLSTREISTRTKICDESQHTFGISPSSKPSPT